MSSRDVHKRLLLARQARDRAAAELLAFDYREAGRWRPDQALDRLSLRQRLERREVAYLAAQQAVEAAQQAVAQAIRDRQNNIAAIRELGPALHQLGATIRANRERAAAIRDRAAANAAPAVAPTAPPDPRQMVTSAQVDATRRQLEAEGRPSGERSIAKELSISRDAVRFALGKDRKRAET